MLDSLGGHAVRFAPEGELNMGGGVLARLVAGGVVGDTIGRGWLRLGRLAAVGEDSTAEQDCVDHEFPPATEEVTHPPSCLTLRFILRGFCIRQQTRTQGNLLSMKP